MSATGRAGRRRLILRWVLTILAAAMLTLGCLGVGDPAIGRGSIGGIEGSQATVEAIYIGPDGDNRHVFAVKAVENLDGGYELPATGDELTVSDYNRGATFESGVRYLLFVSEDLSGQIPLLRFTFDLDKQIPVSGHDEPARLADGGVHDGRPLAQVLDCLQSELGLPSRGEVLRRLGRDTDPAARLRATERSGSWLALLSCDPGDDGHPEP